MIAPDPTGTDWADKAPDDPEPEAAPQSAAWARLRAQHAEASKVKPPLLLELPEPYEGVYVQYKYVPLSGRNKKALAKVREMEDATEQQRWALVDLLIDCCQEIMVANPDDDRADDAGIAPLCDPGDPPIKFNLTLARGMQWEDAEMLTSRRILRRLFGDDNGDYTLLAHAVKVMEWMERGRPAVAEAFSGE